VDEVMAKHDSFTDFLMNKGDKISEELENDAKTKLGLFEVTKAQIYEDLDVVFEKLDTAKLKIIASVKGPDNPKGLLTRRQKSYLDCLAVHR